MFKTIHKFSLEVKQWMKQNFKYQKSNGKEIQLGKEIQYQIYTNEEFEKKTARRNSNTYLNNKYFPILSIFSWNSRARCSYSKKSVKHLTKLASISVNNEGKTVYKIQYFTLMSIKIPFHICCHIGDKAPRQTVQ